MNDFGQALDHPLQTLPDEEEPKAFDWQGKPLYPGETVYSIENEYVREDDLKAFIENSVGKPVEI
ncbi:MULTISPECIES: hypothetical protein [Enterococcus]|uniref:hypothetical protein n=1 Tax=Enterococcus TaxID=1350 RepID=UPI000A33799E|nr:hypothetical protein [Enterococcus sp. 3G1_DIV0629]EME8124141.1 hypothetical protein [Enterococcus faecium]OTO28354.1 hypothetical protein A5816_000620 [Enterococcus sp. 3G1_DIV0629]